MGKANYGNESFCHCWGGSESHGHVFSLSPRNFILCPILVLKMQERSGQTGGGQKEDDGDH